MTDQNTDLVETKRWQNGLLTVKDIDDIALWTYYSKVLRILPSRSLGPTACTNGHVIYFNPDFGLTLNDKEIAFVAQHELIHVVLKHPFRCPEEIFEETDKKSRARLLRLWNKACD